LLCLKYAYTALSASKGKVVIVNSLASRTYSLFSGVEYTMSKSALSGMVKQLSIEFAKDDISINSIFPSMTATPMLLTNVEKDKLLDIEDEIPMKRLATPLEIAKAITFLISEDNTYMTGCGIDLNGGQFLNG
jgi:NAD(P)-dependent dehydrogenase (short-subunit alcohol dehydrogenase family)